MDSKTEGYEDAINPTLQNLNVGMQMPVAQQYDQSLHYSNTKWAPQGNSNIQDKGIAYFTISSMQSIHE